MIPLYKVLETVIKSGSISSAAKMIGINRNSLSVRIRQSGIDIDKIDEFEVSKNKYQYQETLKSLNESLKFNDLTLGERRAIERVIKNIEKRVA